MSKIFVPGKRQFVPVTFTGIGISVIVLVIVLTLGLYWMSSAHGRSAKLEYVSGEVLVTNPDAAGEWRKLSGDIRVHAEQQIKVARDAVARLVFNDGSRIMLDAGARITVEELRGNWFTSLQAVIIQEAGRTRHSIHTLHGPGSGYQVVTPSGTVIVAGTNFTVAIDESGYTRFSVDKGKVVVQNDAAGVTISSGQAIVARGGALEDYAAFQFSLSGIPRAGKAGTWSVNGVPFLVDEKTLVKGDLQVVSPVFVEGRILGGQWIADLIIPMPGRESLSSFTGILSQMDDETWVVGGEEITLSPDIDIVGRPKAGEAVQVVFRVSGESNWVADVIITLGETDEVLQIFVTPTNTLEPTSTRTPFPSSTPTPSPTPSGTVSPVPSTVPSNTPTSTRPPRTYRRPTATQAPNPETNPQPVPTTWVFPSATPTVWNIFSTPTRTATWWPTPTPSKTYTPRPTNTPRPTSTPGPTNTPKPTKTPRPTNTPKITATAFPTPTRTPTWTATLYPTNTPTDEPTQTRTPEPTNTPTDWPTATEPAPTDTPVPTETPVPTDTPAAP